MLHHERTRPPHEDYTPDEWNLIEKAFHPEFVAQTESLFALGNGYLGMRGVPEEGDPSVQNGTFINGFYEEWPIVYSETAYGFARTGQTMLNVTDSKIIRLFVDDEPFSVGSTNIRHYDRRLNLTAGTLDRELHWETPSGKLVRIRTRRLISFRHRHVAAITYEVMLLNQEAPVVISSEMHCHTPEVRKTDDDPRRAKMFTGDVLRHRAGYVRDRRVVLAHGTERSHMIVACGIDHEIETDCQHSHKSSHNENFGQVAFSAAALPGKPIHLTKYIAYHTATAANPDSLCDRVEWTLDRTAAQGFATLLKEQQNYLDSFWHRSDVSVGNIDSERARLTTVEIQQAIRVNLFHILQASARAESTGRSKLARESIHRTTAFSIASPGISRIHRTTNIHFCCSTIH
jgi:alpha,alpha-trehalose phosphorylase